MVSQVVQEGVSAGAVVDALLDCGVTHVVWLVDSETGALYDALTSAEQQGRLTTIPICREGEAIAVSLGLLIGGRKPVVIIQNTGLFESGDSLRGHAIDLELPVVMLIGYRGWKADKTAITDSAATYLEPVLDAYGVPHRMLSGANFRDLIPDSFRQADERGGPVAILVPAEWEASS
jgi:sulfopyruvate decarboxylase TPP-binding subunit